METQDRTGEDGEDQASLAGFLAGAAFFAGLLLVLGCGYVLFKVGDSEVYRKEAAGTLWTLRILKYLGAGLALFGAVTGLRSLRKRGNR